MSYLNILLKLALPAEMKTHKNDPVMGIALNCLFQIPALPAAANDMSQSAGAQAYLQLQLELFNTLDAHLSPVEISRTSLVCTKNLTVSW